MKRYKVAKEYITNNDEWYNNVIFDDESKFNIYDSDGRIRVWRK